MGVVISCWGDREPGKCQALGVLLGEVAVCIQRPVDVGDLRSMLETQSVRTCLRLGFVKENSDSLVMNSCQHFIMVLQCEGRGPW